MRPANVLFIDGLPPALKSEDLREYSRDSARFYKHESSWITVVSQYAAANVMMESEAEASRWLLNQLLLLGDNLLFDLRRTSVAG